MVVEADRPCQADKVIEAEISLSDRSSSVADKVSLSRIHAVQSTKKIRV